MIASRHASPSLSLGPYGTVSTMGRIAVDSVTVRYGDRLAVDGVSFTARAGDVVALVGPNGSGKSSLLRAAAGLLRCGGQVRCDGRIAFLPQDNGARAALTVMETVLLGRIRALGMRVAGNRGRARGLDLGPARYRGPGDAAGTGVVGRAAAAGVPGPRCWRPSRPSSCSMSRRAPWTCATSYRCSPCCAVSRAAAASSSLSCSMTSTRQRASPIACLSCATAG
jgi:energy-coupling factor transporter ATP-binding protein EcfA2